MSKRNSKQIEDLNVRPETIKFLRENISSNFLDTGFSNIFLHGSPLARETKPRLNYRACTQINRFFTAKDNINKTNRQSTDCILGENVNWCNHGGKQYISSS